MGSMIQRRSDDAFFKPKKVHPKRSAGGFPISGPRTRARQEANREMNKEFREKGYPQRCELRYDGICVGTIYPHWAHWDKSEIFTDEKGLAHRGFGLRSVPRSCRTETPARR